MAGTMCCGSRKWGRATKQVTPGLADALNANKATFAGNETMLAVVTQLKELYDLGFMGRNALADTYADAPRSMASGKVAMVLSTTAFANLLEHDYPEMKADDIGVFLMPLADNQMLNLNPAGPTHFVYSGSPHIDRSQAVSRLPGPAREPAVLHRQFVRCHHAALRRRARASSALRSRRCSTPTRMRAARSTRPPSTT